MKTEQEILDFFNQRAEHHLNESKDAVKTDNVVKVQQLIAVINEYKILATFIFGYPNETL